jgi:UPF0755 protein
MVMENKPLRKLIIIVAVVIVVILIIFAVFAHREAIIEISDGTTPKQVARILKNEKIIKSENVFLTFVWLTRTEKKFKPGIYKLSNRMPDFIILKDIVMGNTHKIRVTIPEGFTSQEIAEILEKKGICNSKKFLEIVKSKKLEGYLFPETYFLNMSSNEESIVKMLNNQFEKVFTADFYKRAEDLKMTKEKIVILASIIEKEAKKNEERPLISAVFYNRLKKGWNLESCATVLYALGKHKDFLTYKDTKIVSPYNTYIKPGLPPSPICNPGLNSIKAALYPAVTDDMFFVADGSGTHKFSKYYAEHNSKKKKIIESHNKSK